MDISNIIDIAVSLETPGVGKPGFGTPLLYGSSTVLGPAVPVVEVSTATWSVDLLALGFVASDPVYLAARALASQNPRPNSFKVCYAAQVMGDHDVDLTMLTAVEGETITVTIKGENPSAAGEMTEQTYTRTVPGGSSTTAEATAVAALINAGLWGASGDIVATGVAAVVEIRAAAPFAGKILYYDDLLNCSLDDVTAARTVATDLDLILAYDADWYTLIPVDSGTLDAEACSTWANAQTNKTCIVQTQDADTWTAGTGLVADLKALNHTQSMAIVTKQSLSEMPAAAYAGRFLPETPGTTNWAYKPLTGVTPSRFTSAESGRVHADFGNTYEGVSNAGVEIVSGTLYAGWVLGSSETFMDLIRLRDAMIVEVQTGVVSLQTASRKVPFNDSGIAQIQAAMLEGIRVYEDPDGGFTPGSAFVNVPTAASVSAANKAARTLPGVSFGATANGAIIKVTATGTIAI